MSIKIGQEEIKLAIKQYIVDKLNDSVKPNGEIKVNMIIHNSYSDQRSSESSPGSAEAEIEIPI